MVADKSKFDRDVVDQPQCADISEKSNLDITPSSSSDESLKSKSESEERSNQSLDSSDKNESGDDDRKIFNSTYLCPKSTSVNEEETDQKSDEEKNERCPNLTLLKTVDNTVGWKYSSTSYKRNLDITQWSDLKLENFTVEDSFTAKDMADESTIMGLRKWLVDYQELRGTSREEYTFSTLIRVIGQATGRCLFALFYVIFNIAPAVMEIFLHIARFVLDKMIDIKETESTQQMVTKTGVFAVQLVCIYICLVFIFGFIVWPVIRMTFGILTKIMLYD